MPERLRRNTRFFRITGAVVLVGVAVASVLMVFVKSIGGTELGDPVITIEEVVNRVETERRREPNLGGTFLPAPVGQELMPGDGIKTYADSEARIDIMLSTVTRITRTTPNSIWRLGMFGLEGGIVIELSEGKIFLIEDSGNDELRPVKIVTPAGTASPRGTWMSVEYDPEEGMVQLQCFRGVCALENRLGVQLLTDEQKTTTTARSAPAKPTPLTQRDKLAFTKLPEIEKGEMTVPAIVVVPPTPTLTPPPANTPTPTLEPTQAPQPTPTVARTFPRYLFPEVTPTPKPSATPLPISTPTPQPTPVPAPVAQPTPTPNIILAPTPVLLPLGKLMKQISPHGLWGTVHVEGFPAQDGTLITAWIDGFIGPVAEGVVANHSYLLVVHQHGTDSFAGRMLTFKIGNQTADETATWRLAGADALNLTSSQPTGD